MEVLVQQQYQSQYGTLGSNKVKDWIRTFTPPSSIGNNIANKTSTTPITAAPAAPTTGASATAATLQSKATNISKFNNTNLSYLSQNKNTNKMRNSINKNKINRTVVESSSNLSGGNNMNNIGSSSSSNNINNNISKAARMSQQQQQQQQQYKIGRSYDVAFAYNIATTTNTNYNNNHTNAITTTTTTSDPTIKSNTSNNGGCFLYCDDVNVNRVNELSLRLLDELRAAKSQHLACTEVSLPCDLTQNIAAEILRISEKEPCGIRGCTIFIEFEDEPNNSRRIATLKLDAETVSTFEVYLTLQQDHRGWTSLLPQFMKSLTRTITISPKFKLTKHKLYTPYQGNSLNDIAIGDIDLIVRELDGGRLGAVTTAATTTTTAPTHAMAGANAVVAVTNNYNTNTNTNNNNNNIHYINNSIAITTTTTATTQNST